MILINQLDEYKVYHIEDLFYLGKIRAYCIRDDNHIQYKVDRHNVDDVNSNGYDEFFLADSMDEALEFFD